MSNKIFIISVFISNIAFGSSLPITKIENVLTIQERKSLTTKAIDYLYKKGLDKDIATKRVEEALIGSNELNSILSKNILNTLNIDESALISYISTQALKNRKVDLSSYSTLIELAQKNSIILDKNMTTKIEKLSEMNENRKSI
jgi:hypothetical protein